MCTLTWRRETVGTFEIFFNRDEKKTRSVAEPPRVHDRDGVSFLTPIDPDGGGTWMVANERGLVVCLLNRWHEEHSVQERPPKSRGQLVMETGGLDFVPAVEEYLRSQDLTGVRPFTMVAFDRVGERGWEWNGVELMPAELSMPLCSSSFQFEEVATARKTAFRDLSCARVPPGELLERYHSNTGTEGSASAFTVRMCRPDAQTMSRSRVRVGRDGIHWLYLEERPELEGEPRLFETEL